MLGVDGRGDTGGPPAARCARCFPLTNRRDDSPRNRFSITADDVRAAERAAAASRDWSWSAGITRIPTIRRGPANSIANTPGLGIAT